MTILHFKENSGVFVQTMVWSGDLSSLAGEKKKIIISDPVFLFMNESRDDLYC